MRSIAAVVAILLFGSFASFAGVINDPFNQSQAGCYYSLTTPFGTCDVIGNELLFDIQSASVSLSPTLLDTNLYFNYGGGSSLAPFSTPVLYPGDLFFYDPANPLTTTYDSQLSYPEYEYGVPLVNHNGLLAGDLYQISNPNGLQTAQEVIDPSNLYQSLDYRRTQPVWMPGGETLVDTGIETVSNYGNGTSNALYDVDIKIPNPTAGLLALISAGQIGIGFESATCANDVLVGLVAVPEPGSLLMVAAGMGLLGLGVWRRRNLR